MSSGEAHNTRLCGMRQSLLEFRNIKKMTLSNTIIEIVLRFKVFPP